jgi:hypothetical protein
MARPKQHGAHFYQEIEPVDRERFDMDVPLCKRTGSSYQTVQEVTVSVLPTFCPQLVIHESVDSKSEGLVLTHVPTGACVARNIPDERAGRLLAGALAFLFRWSADRREKIKAQVQDLDPKIAAWIKSLNTADIQESQ